VEAEEIEEGKHTARLDRHDVVPRVRITVGTLAAAHREPDQPVPPAQRRRELVEIPRVPRQAGEAKQRQPHAPPPPGKRDPVRRREPPAHAPAGPGTEQRMPAAGRRMIAPEPEPPLFAFPPTRLATPSAPRCGPSASRTSCIGNPPLPSSALPAARVAAPGRNAPARRPASDGRPA